MSNLLVITFLVLNKINTYWGNKDEIEGFGFFSPLQHCLLELTWKSLGTQELHMFAPVHFAYICHINKMNLQLIFSTHKEGTQSHAIKPEPPICQDITDGRGQCSVAPGEQRRGARMPW